MKKNRYQYIAIDLYGALQRNTLIANSKHDILKQLAKSHLTPIHITNQYAWLRQNHLSSLNDSRVAEFTEQLYRLLEQSTDLPTALKRMAIDTPSHAIRWLSEDLLFQLQQGSTLSHALTKHPKYFNAFYCQLIHAGERSNQLCNTLQLLSTQLASQVQWKNQLRRALYYPSFVLLIGIIITAGILQFIVPKFSELFQQFNATLPQQTQQLLWLSHSIKQHGLVALASLVTVFSLSRLAYQKIAALRFASHHLLLKTPHLSEYIRQKNLAQWSLSLSLLLRAKLNLIEALNLSQNVVDNPIYRHAFAQTLANLQRGQSLRSALKTHPMIHASTLHYFSSHQCDDRLADQLTRLHKNATQFTENTTQQATRWIEPLLLLLIAVVIGGIMVALYMPIFRMGMVF